jgi:hypothetical protein
MPGTLIDAGGDPWLQFVTPPDPHSWVVHLHVHQHRLKRLPLQDKISEFSDGAMASQSGPATDLKECPICFDPMNPETDATLPLFGLTFLCLTHKKILLCLVPYDIYGPLDGCEMLPQCVASISAPTKPQSVEQIEARSKLSEQCQAIRWLPCAHGFHKDCIAESQR